MSEWYSECDGNQEGPFDSAEMMRRRSSGLLQPDQLVWRAGMSDWEPAGTFASFADPPPADLPGQPAMLSYATPVTLAAAPGVVIAPIPADDGPFRKLGSQFNTGSGAWFGTVIASPKAIYMLKRTKNSRQSGFAVGGLIGVLVTAALESGTTDDTRTCTLADLSPGLRPLLSKKAKDLDKDVIIVARENVNRVTVPAINNVIKIRVGALKMSTNIGIFRNGSIRRWLTDQGWTINADLVATAAPVFGQSFGRPEPLIKKKVHPALRALYILLAIAVFCLVVWLRMQTGRPY